jgi:mannose-6-phosphate isomerase-like protein (cupin superfamily)
MKSVNRAWGHYTVDEDTNSKWKLKTIYVYPNRCLSYQQHKKRAEVWLVKKGKGTAIIGDRVFILEEGGIYNIDSHQWHQLINGTNDLLVIHEIQHGTECEEEDIIRL